MLVTNEAEKITRLIKVENASASLSIILSYDISSVFIMIQLTENYSKEVVAT
jgi:hypothetical protein